MADVSALPSGKVKKIAILGGGISALVAAYELTKESDWENKFDIRVYQLGWRLGGKGASSRNPERYNRIEEHGLHIWLGFYENAFNLMRDCYGAAKSLESPFPNWQDAFKPHSFVVLEEKTEGGWEHWPIEFPVNDSLPGDGGELPTLWDYFVMLLQWMLEALAQSKLNSVDAESDIPVEISSWSAAAMQAELDPRERQSLPPGEKLLHAAHRRARRRRKRLLPFLIYDQPAISALVQDFGRRLDHLEQRALSDTELRRAFIPVDLTCAIATGMLADHVFARGLDHLDEVEFRDWLRKYGASELSISSAWIRGAYDLMFSYQDGVSTKPNIGAGVAVRILLRVMFTYKGAVLWKMQAGMGETVFTPLYLVLRDRGVKFQFFNKVERLSLSQDRSRVEAIHLRRQATIKKPGYEPLVPVNGMLCWRHEPDYDQLLEGAELKRSGSNLESHWSAWPGVADCVLKDGVDYDAVILGIPIAALTDVCAELIDSQDRWRKMMEKVRTVQTQGFQVWLSKDLEECGWKLQSPILGSYVEPLDTWADMTHLLAVEGWPADQKPKQLAYFCGVMTDASPIPPATDQDFPAKEMARTQRLCVEYLREYVGYLWPAAVPRDGSGFDWAILDSSGTGEARFASQYWRPNIDPSERYVLAVAGSTAYRLATNESGCANLFLTGDWIRNGLNSPGCIESAVISGRQAARALSGDRYEIIGEKDASDLMSPWLLWLIRALALCGRFFLSISRFFERT